MKVRPGGEGRSEVETMARETGIGNTGWLKGKLDGKERGRRAFNSLRTLKK